MPAPKTVLRDIADLDLDPELEHKKTDKSGRLKATEQVESVEVPVKQELKYGLKVPKNEEVPVPTTEPTVDPVVTPAATHESEGETPVDDVEETEVAEELSDKTSGSKKKSKKK